MTRAACVGAVARGAVLGVDRPGVFGQCRAVRLARRSAAAALSLRASRRPACRRAPAHERAPARGAGAAAAAAPAPPPPRGKQIALLYSSNLRRRLRAVRLPGAPAGRHRAPGDGDRSRARRGRRGAGARRRRPVPAPRARLRGGKPPDAGEIERRARLLAAALRADGHDRVPPGRARPGARACRCCGALAKQARIPLVSANLYGRDGKRLFDADRIVDAAGVKVGVFGVTAAPTPDDAAAFKAAGIEARDPAAAARDEVAGAARARRAGGRRAGARRRRPRRDRKLLAAVPGIDWAVLGPQRHEPGDARERSGGARMLEAMIEGKHARPAGPARRRRQRWRSPTAASAPRSRPSSPTTAASSPSTTGGWATPIRPRCATTTSSARQRDRRRRSRARRALLQRAARARSPAAGSRTASSRSTRRRPTSRAWRPGRRLQPRERAPRGGRASRSASGTRRRGTAPASRGAPAAGGATAPAAQLPRHRRLRRAATRPRSRSGRRPSTRARWPRWRASAATAIRPASAATSPATCSRAARADARRGARRPSPNVGCEACHGAGQGPPRGAPTRRSRPPAPSPRRSAAAATPPTSPTASSTTRSSSQAIVGPGHGQGARPCSAQLSCRAPL